MTSVATLQPDPAPIVACTVSRDVQNFEILIDDMLDQPDSAALEFIAVAVDADDEGDLTRVTDVVKKAKEKGVKVVLVANQVSPMALHQLMRLGADDFVPYPLPEGALHEKARCTMPSNASAAPPSLPRWPPPLPPPWCRTERPPPRRSRPRATVRACFCRCMACRAARAGPPLR